jgi:tRNA pseudouridine38-40 synthase
MPNYKLIIEYDGTNYAGWQVQKSPKSPQGASLRDKQVPSHKRKNKRERITIQGTLEKVLTKILQEEIKVVASGRTDAGVHALGQVANFKTNSRISPGELKRALNSLLPGDIRISKAETADDEFHSRFCAKSKLYRYQISQKFLSCFDRFYFTFVPYQFDIQLMKREARALVGRHDFKAFQGAKRKAKRTERTIKDIKIKKRGRCIFIDIEADGFLCHMARNIVGTLIEIGRGRYPEGSMEKILTSRNRKKAGPTADSKGLFLIRVKY